jgi:hypothetical protein
MWLVSEPADVDLILDIPRQPGLLFHVNLNLQGDELHLGAGESFHVEWFPCTDADIEARFFESVRGILSGHYRIAEYRRRGETVRAVLERPTEHGWKKCGRWMNLIGILPTWGAKEVVLQNRQSPP